jgi:hypothetical protein
VKFAAITLCVASQRVIIVDVYFVIDSVRKGLETPLYIRQLVCRIEIMCKECKEEVMTCFKVLSERN